MQGGFPRHSPGHSPGLRGCAVPLAAPLRCAGCGRCPESEEGVKGPHLSCTGPCPSPRLPFPPAPPAPRCRAGRPPTAASLRICCGPGRGNGTGIPERRSWEGAEGFPSGGSRQPCSPPCPPSLIKRALLFFQPRCPLSERCPRRVTQAAGAWHGVSVPFPASPGRAARGDGGCPGSGEPRPGLRPLPSARPSPLFEFLATELNKSGCCKLN